MLKLVPLASRTGRTKLQQMEQKWERHSMHQGPDEQSLGGWKGMAWWGSEETRLVGAGGPQMDRG